MLFRTILQCSIEPLANLSESNLGSHIVFIQTFVDIFVERKF